MLYRMLSSAPARPRLLLPAEPDVTTSFRLPARVTPIIGRDAELVELAGVLSNDRVVTLTGSGGCGKTRLALELASRVADQYPGGAAWVELASCSDGVGVIGAVALAVDVVETLGEAIIGCVVQALSSRAPTLLVLDNAEHVLPAVADVVDALAASVGHLTIVCTSREPVGAPGEVIWRVPSLRAPSSGEARHSTAELIEGYDAVRLFVDRARRARRGFTLTDSNAASIAQICSRLDGVPLALELAAARVRTMPPERIAAQLDDRFRLLSGGPRTLMARQQTLHASVAWSEELLDETERAVFRRLGVFVGGCTLAAAETVIGEFGDVEAYDVAEIVGRLVDKSLVQFDEVRDRYSLLDTIRSYALERLIQTGEIERARDAHADWCAAWLRLTDDAPVADVNEWWTARTQIIGRVDPEWPNCATALDWVRPGSPASLRLVAGLGDYWALRQRAADSGRYGMPAVEQGDTTTAEWMAAVVSLQTVRSNSADPDFPRLRERAMALAAERNDRRTFLRLDLARHVTNVLVFGPRHDTIGAIDEVLDEAVQLREWFTCWNAAQSPAVMLAAAGRPAEAEARVAGLTGNRSLLVRSATAMLRGELDDAISLADAVLQRLDRRTAAALDLVLATFCYAGAALARADPSLLAPLRVGDAATEALPGPFLPVFAMAEGVRELLDDDLERAHAVFTAAPVDLFASWRNLGFLAQIELARGEPTAARTAALRLRELSTGVEAPAYDTTVDLVLAECDRLDEPGAALDTAHRALTTAAAFELWPPVVDALEAIGTLLVDGGRVRDAARLLAAADSARLAMGYRFRFRHRRQYVSAATEAARTDDGWGEGALLTLPAAVEVARRMRGERVRAIVGWDSLTPTELRVVEQVAVGLTNPQIAEALLMSRATVKTHLVHVYAKLGITNRAELAAAAARRWS